MIGVELVLDELRRRGELWEAAPGLVAIRGSALELRDALEARIAALARNERAESWLVPPGIALATLARADYFANFPQWLTVAAHLSPDEAALETVARSADPATAVASAVAPPAAALLPAVCYHVYAALEGAELDAPRLVTAQCACWRDEGGRTRPLERGWSFTMREIVCVGEEAAVEDIRIRGREAAIELATGLGLETAVAPAADPFFAPTGRARSLLQRVKALKEELLVPLGRDGSLAIASFNGHERFFGEAFRIRVGGRAASSGCVAFGIERWLLAFLVAHGPDPRDWPELEAPEALIESTFPKE